MKYYLENGQKVELVEKTKQGYLIQDIYEYDGEEYVSEAIPILVERIYEHSPTMAFSSKVQDLREQIKDLIKEKNSINAEMSTLNALKDKLFEKYEPLKTVDLFLKGKITHFVKWDDWTIEIEDFKNTYNEVLRLVYGNDKFYWKTVRRNPYEADYTLKFASSYEEARKIAQDVLNQKRFERVCQVEELIRVAKEYNLIMPAELMKNLKIAEKEDAIKQIQSAKIKIEDLKKSIKDLQKNIEKEN